MNEQHFRLEKSFGFLIHPAIPLDRTNPEFKIADIATGTGIWLTEAARHLPPTWKFDGFDISSAQFPSPSDLPSNVSFHEQNALQPFPERCHGYYDVIAVRLLHVALGNDDWEKVCNNLKHCLSECTPHCSQFSILHSYKIEPGGYLQWIEPDLSPSGWKTISLVPSAPKDALERAIATLHKLGQLTGKDYSSQRRLASLLEAEGFQDIQHDVMAVDREDVRMGFTADLARAFIPLYKKYSSMEGSDITTEEAVKVGEEARTQALEGRAYNRMDFHIIVGRK